MKNWKCRGALTSVVLSSAAVAAPVSWTGAGDGTNWSDPLNWSTGVLPTAADDVTINVAQNPTVVINGVNPTIRSLNAAEILQVNAGTTLSVTTTAASTAPINLNGGTVSGGAWTLTGGGQFVAPTNVQSIINNAAISGELVLAVSSARVRVQGTTTFTTARLRGQSSSLILPAGYTLNGQIIAEGAANGSCYIELASAGTLTVAPGAIIQIAADSTLGLNVLQSFWVGSGVLDLRGTIRNASARALAVNATAMTVAATGRIENTGAGTTTVGVTANPQTWSSAGTIAVSSGVMTFEDAWTNTGTIQVSGTGRLELGGAFTSPGIGTLSRSGGTIAVTGAWDNAAGYTLNATTGSFVLQGGTVTGGTLNVANGSILDITSADNQMIGVNYGGELVLADSSDRVRLGAGTTVAAVRLQGQSTAVGFPANAVINFPIIVEGTATGNRYIEVYGPTGPLTIGPAGSITLAGSFNSGGINVGASFWYGAATTVTNNGAMNVQGVANGASRVFNVRGSSFVNNGTMTGTANGNFDINPTTFFTNAGSISVAGGTTTLGSQWSSTGTIASNGATLELAGTFGSAAAATISRTGGSVDVTGVWDGGGTTFVMTAARGDWNLRGGTLRNGSFDFNGARIIPGNANSTLENAVFLDEVALESASARLKVFGTTTMPALRLRSTSNGVGFGDGFVLTFPVIFDMPTQSNAYLESAAGNSSWTIGPSGSIGTAATNVGTPNIGVGFWYARSTSITNQGSISMSTAARTMTVNPVAFVNSGTMSVSAGAMAIETAQGAFGGLTLSGAGSAATLNGSYNLSGTINVPAGTTLSLNGTWASGGTINLNAGTLNLGGTFTVATLGAFTNVGGIVNITGTLNNPGTLALNAATGTWRLMGGTISGGTLTQSGGAVLAISPDNANTLTNVTLPQQLALTETSARVRLTGTTNAASYRLGAQSTSIGFSGGTVVNGNVIADGVAGSRFMEVLDNGVVTFGPSSRLTATGDSVTLSLSPFWFGGAGNFNIQGVAEKIGSGSINATRVTNFDSSTFTLTGGTWRGVSGGGVNFANNRVHVNNATVELTGPGPLGDFAYLRENNGSFTMDDNRDGTLSAATDGVSAFVNRGRLKLGTGSRLQMGVNGAPCSYTQTAAGTLEVELGGVDTAAGFGSLRVFGEAVLNGTIRAAYVNGFPRQCGQIFQFLDANSRTGQFSQTDLPEITDETLFLLFYGGADARFSVSARADFNQDGFLDFFDYDDFVRCFEGDCAPGMDADFNRDGFVDFFDYDDFVFRFEAGCS